MTAFWRPAALGLAALSIAACGDRNADQAAGEAATGAVASINGLAPREMLFGEPARFRGRLSPDGAMVSWLAPHQGVLNVWAASSEHPEEAEPITSAAGYGVSIYEWARNSTHIVFLEKLDSGEATRIGSVNVATGETIDLTPGGDDTRSRLVGMSWDYPDEIVIAANDRDEEAFDLYRVNLITGESRRIYENTEGFTRLIVDSNFEVRIAERPRPDGGRDVLRRTRDREWELLYQIDFVDSEQSWIIDFDATNRAIYALDSSGADAARLVRMELDTGVRQILGAIDGADIGYVLLHPVTNEADAFAVSRLNREWIPLTSRGAAAITFLDEQLGENYIILSRSVDDRRWIVYDSDAINPGSYFVFDREEQTLEHLLDVQPALSARPRIRRNAVVIPSRDGLEMISYLTLPEGADEDEDGRPEHTSPLVIIVPDGPGYREHGEYDEHQDWLSDRGYAVLAVNPRGSWGFGKTFLNAGARELGGAVVDDIVDVAQWAVDQGVAEPGRIGIAAASLGGVTAIGALAAHPDRFACVGTVGAPMDVARFVEDTPPYWRAYQPWFDRFIGDASTEEGRAALAAISPLTLASEIERPILVVHGDEDPRGQAGLAREFAETIAENGGEAVFLRFPDEGVSISRAPNRIAMHAVAEQFFADCLGGNVAPITVEDLAGSSIEAPVGLDEIEGLSELLANASVVAER